MSSAPVGLALRLQPPPPGDWGGAGDHQVASVVPSGVSVGVGVGNGVGLGVLVGNGVGLGRGVPDSDRSTVGWRGRPGVGVRVGGASMGVSVGVRNGVAVRIWVAVGVGAGVAVGVGFGNGVGVGSASSVKATILTWIVSLARNTTVTGEGHLRADNVDDHPKTLPL